jgi:hypothetical protein
MSAPFRWRGPCRNRDLGTWQLFEIGDVRLCGSTPRHADTWSIDLDIRGFLLGFAVDVRDWYAQFTFWPRERCHRWTVGKHRLHRKFPFAYSFGCACLSDPRRKPRH